MKNVILIFALVSVLIVAGCAVGATDQEVLPVDYGTWGEPDDSDSVRIDQYTEQTNEAETASEFLLSTQPSLEGMLNMAITDFDESQNQLTVTISNHSEYELMTGVHFTVEAFDGTDWQSVPWRDESIAFVDLGYSINPGESIEFVKNLNLVIPLEQGLYRIRKSVFRTIDTPIRDGDMHDLIAEFYW